MKDLPGTSRMLSIEVGRTVALIRSESTREIEVIQRCRVCSRNVTTRIDDELWREDSNGVTYNPGELVPLLNETYDLHECEVIGLKELESLTLPQLERQFQQAELDAVRLMDRATVIRRLMQAREAA